LRVTKILLVRHGHVEGIKPERFRGRVDLALTALGREQANRVAQRIASKWKPQAVYTSPLDRCIATGAAIASACNSQHGILDDLIDIDYGAWQFRSVEDVAREDPKLFGTWLTAPHLVRFPGGGESLQDLVARTSDALRHCLELHVHETVVLVGHESVNRALLLQLLDQALSSYWRLAQAPCCINEIDISGGRVEIVRVNETAHLDGIVAG
jgi:phosphoserine phosphatase